MPTYDATTMYDITAELSSCPTEARDAFAASYGATFTDNTESVTMTAGAIMGPWVQICAYALPGLVGEAGVLSFSATPLV